MIRALGLGIVFIVTGCHTARVGDLRKEFAGPEYARSVEATHYVVEIRYVPRLKRLVERMGWEDSSVLDKKRLDSLLRAEPKGGLLLAMTILPKEASRTSDLSQDLVYGTENGFTDYRQALEAFQFGLKKRIWIECRNRKIDLSQSHMENFFGLTSGRVFLLSFPDLGSALGEAPETFTLVLDDLVPGLSRSRLSWDLPIGKYDEKI